MSTEAHDYAIKLNQEEVTAGGIPNMWSIWGDMTSLQGCQLRPFELVTAAHRSGG